jgi:hypothetical protein
MAACFQTPSLGWLTVKVKVTLRLVVYRQTVRLGVKPLESHDKRFFFWLNPCSNSAYITFSLTRRRLLWICLAFRQMTVKVKVTLRLAVSQSVSQSWCRSTSGAHGQIFITVWQVPSCVCGAPSLTRRRVWLLYMLLVLASAVFLGSESLGTRDRILLPKIWDFPFRRLLRLAGSRWNYSSPLPHGYQVTAS